MKEQVQKLNEQFKDKSAEEVLKAIIEQYPGKTTLSTSLGAEDQVLLHMMHKVGGDFSVFTLDTGRVFPETYEVIDETSKKYGITIEVFFPDYTKVQDMVNTKGVNLFYDSIDDRKMCCNIRKNEPLSRALPGKEVWVTGLRKEQSLNRFYTELFEWDEKYEMIKVNPLLTWSEKNVWNYIKENDVPYNKLHDQGFPSIGCRPCTRAVKKGDDPRSGRWWWEEPEHNECGLHVKE